MAAARPAPPEAAGGVVTPIPIVLDGAEHTIERALEPVALRTAPGTRYRVQIVPTSSVYHPQRAEGLLDVVRAEAELPVVDAAAARAWRWWFAGRSRGRSRCACCVRRSARRLTLVRARRAGC